MEQSLILNGQQVEQKLLRMSQELIELHYGTQHEVIFIGIKEMGFEIAQTLFHFSKAIQIFPVDWKVFSSKKEIQSQL